MMERKVMSTEPKAACSACAQTDIGQTGEYPWWMTLP